MTYLHDWFGLSRGVKSAETRAAGPDHPAVLADFDPELHGLPPGILACVLWEPGLGKGVPRAILLRGAV